MTLLLEVLVYAVVGMSITLMIGVLILFALVQWFNIPDVKSQNRIMWTLRRLTQLAWTTMGTTIIAITIYCINRS